MDRNQTFDAGLPPQTPRYREEPRLDEEFDNGVRPAHRNLTEIVQDLYRDMAVLVEQEGRLLRQELSEKATIVKASSMSMATGFSLVFIGVQALVAAAIIGLSFVIEWWAAALIVGAVLLAVGAIMVVSAKKAMKIDNLKPKKSADALSHMSMKLKERAHELYH